MGIAAEVPLLSDRRERVVLESRVVKRNKRVIRVQSAEAFIAGLRSRIARGHGISCGDVALVFRSRRGREDTSIHVIISRVAICRKCVSVNRLGVRLAVRRTAVVVLGR